MSKKNFVSLVLGTLGGMLFALGMCMALIPEWNSFKPGVIMGAAGIAVLLIMLMVRRKMEGKPLFAKPSLKALGIAAVTAAGTLAFALGMVMVLVWDMMLYGIVLGMAGIIILLFLIPMVKVIK